MKSEPDVWSLEKQKKAGAKGAAWDGVRNYQAANNLKAMKVGDLCFFYHSNIGKEVVGVVKVLKEAFIDKTDFAITGILHLVLVVRIWCENNISREVDVLNTVVIRDRKDTRLLRRRSCGKGHF